MEVQEHRPPEFPRARDEDEVTRVQRTKRLEQFERRGLEVQGPHPPVPVEGPQGGHHLRPAVRSGGGVGDHQHGPFVGLRFQHGTLVHPARGQPRPDREDREQRNGEPGMPGVDGTVHDVGPCEVREGEEVPF